MHAKRKELWVGLHDDALLERLRCTLGQERSATAEVLALMAEVDRRRLYAQAACASMFAYATDVLGLSESAAYKRIHVARAARRYPTLLERIADGRLHLSGLCLLVPHLTVDNHAELLDAASNLGKRQIEQLVAERFPKPDVRTSLHKQPAPSQPPTQRQTPTMAAPIPVTEQTDLPAPAPEPTRHGMGSAPTGTVQNGSLSGDAPRSAVCPRPAVVHRQHHLQPLAPQRYLLKVTLSAQVREKLQKCQDLLGEQVPDGDIATVLEQALDALMAKQLKAKYAVGVKARRTPSPPQTAPKGRAAGDKTPGSGAVPPKRSRAIPAAIRRAVYERDGGQCSYVDPKTGLRCQARRHLEFHHRLPFARGGSHSVGNVCLLCAAHNAHRARLDFGPAHIEAAMAARQSAPSTPCLPRGQLQLLTNAGSSG